MRNAVEMYADIVIPVARGPFTYRVEEAEASRIRRGMGIEVRVGARKRYMGIVWRVHTCRPAFSTKPAGRLMGDGPLLTPAQMELWEWVADYYMCTLGDVMRFAMPAALKPAGLTEEEFRRGEYRPASVRYVKLGPAAADERMLHAALEGLRRAKAQYAALVAFCAAFPDGGVGGGALPRSALAVAAPVLNKLVDKGIFTLFDREVPLSGEGTLDVSRVPLAALSPAQERALEEVRNGFASQDCVLLHGVTGSGKTELYMYLIADALARGRSVLYMMPEIAMTSQLVARIRSVFGNRVTLYHSKLGDRRRAEVYRRLLGSQGGELVLGVRSAVFLPLPAAELIIVDEEHDQSYKQAEPAPRYNARDCAVWMARRWGAKCLLASATPSIESYVNATGGKYALVTLAERYGEGRLPHIVVSDSARAFRRGERRLHFDKALLDRMVAALDDGRQVMLFQNRRGFAPWVECPQCGWVAHCPRCSVTLTYHKLGDRLKCHMCGYSSSLPAGCPRCGTPTPKLMGFGTEKVEEEVAALFPSARILRLDRDTATSPARYERIVTDFERGAADVLVGTQMVTKGFDFPDLGLVGILNADNLLNYPDFRASERAYQTMTQVAGRAGRAAAGGEVVIQTMQPDHPVVRQGQTLDYEGMVRTQLAERSVFGYPPYGKLVVVSLRYRDERLLGQAAAWVAARMRSVFGERVYGPHAPVVEKVGGESYLEILLKVENGRSPARAKEALAGILEEVARHEEYKRVFVFCDVDPQ